MSYQPKTGVACTCKPGVQRDNCPTCEGTGKAIDFQKIRRLHQNNHKLALEALGARVLEILREQSERARLHDNDLSITHAVASAARSLGLLSEGGQS